MNYFFTCYNVLFGRSFPRLEETLSTESKLAVGNRDYFVSSFEEVKKHYQAMIDKWKGTKLYADDDFLPCCRNSISSTMKLPSIPPH